MKGISNVVFQDAVNGLSENIDAIRPSLEAYGFSPRDEDDLDNVFELKDLTKSVVVAVEEQKVILHAGFCRRIRENAVEDAACKLMELNAEHRLLLSMDLLDNEICYEYTFMLSACPLTAEAFEEVFDRFMQTVDMCEALIAREMRPYFIGLLAEKEDPEALLRRLLHRRREHPVFDFREGAIHDDDDDDADDDDDDVSFGDLIEMPDPDDDDDD